MNKHAFLLILLSAVVPPLLSAESNLQAVSKSARLPVRLAPKTSSKAIGYMAAGETVAVLQQSSFTAKVGRVQDDWFQVTTPAGVTGWVFGADLDVNVRQDIAAGLKKTFVGVETPPFPEGTEYFGGKLLRHYPNLGLDHMVWHGNVLMIWLNEIHGKLPSVRSKLRDVLVIPPFHYGQRDMLSGCQTSADPWADLYVVVQETAGGEVKPLRAWKIDAAKKAFREIAVKGVTCQAD